VSSDSGQKFIRRNRPPRVQIEYDVQIGDAMETVNLPFVMGVLADLSGKSAEPLQPLEKRQFFDIDAFSFNERMKAMKPRVAFRVPNTISGEGELNVDITFENIEDFAPDAVARKLEPLRQLLEARSQLSNLMSWMEGRTQAEEEITKLLADPALREALAAQRKPTDKGEEEGEDTPNQA
jgi:type VI secretion system protein ImpB